MILATLGILAGGTEGDKDNGILLITIWTILSGNSKFPLIIDHFGRGR
jgi:hypothetical protein